MEKIEIFKGKDGNYYWRVVAPNGEITQQSEGYVSKSNARRAARLLADKFLVEPEIIEL